MKHSTGDAAKKQAREARPASRAHHDQIGGSRRRDNACGRQARWEPELHQPVTLTFGPAEGAGIIVIGKQEGAPAIDLYLVLR